MNRRSNQANAAKPANTSGLKIEAQRRGLTDSRCWMTIVRSFPFFMVCGLLALTACRQPDVRGGEVGQFSFITTNTTLQEVVDRVGKYDRISGSGIQMFEYDLGDGSKVVLWPDWRFTPTNLIHRVAQVRGTNYTDLMRRQGL